MMFINYVAKLSVFSLPSAFLHPTLTTGTVGIPTSLP